VKVKTRIAALSRRQRRTLIHTGIVFAVGSIFALIFVFLQPFSSINWRLSDELSVPTEVSPNVVVVSIDDESLAKYGRWAEWPRSLHAQAIENLSRAKAQVIGMDILFCDISAEDPVLAQAIQEAGNVVFPVVGSQPLPLEDSRQVYESFLLPNPALRQGAALGHANLASDGDGVVRRLPLVTSDTAGNTYWSFSTVVLCTLFAQPIPPSDAVGNDKLDILGRQIPVDSSGNMRINFSGEPGAYQVLSYSSVVEGDFDPAVVEHKVVLVGMTATAEPDFWITPISPQKMAGVEIHANAIDTILRQRFLTEENWGRNLLICLILAALAALALPRLRLRWGAVLMAGLLVGYLTWAFYAFDHGYLANILYPVMILPLAYFTSLVCRILDEQRDRRRMENVFGRYVSPQVAQEIMRLDDKGALLLGGQRRELTVLFCDARGYTALSEREKPEEVIALINQYFSAIIPCILDNQGMINKFAGDNIMAVWSAPPDQPNHALLAVRAALQAQQAIRELQDKHPNLPKMQFGMGINTGEAVAGNVGSLGRTEYTVIGDDVNVAARLCAAAPGGKIWLGPETYEQVKSYVEVIELEPQYFKGKEKGIKVYEAVGLKR
jgi:adenylate cyclase